MPSDPFVHPENGAHALHPRRVRKLHADENFLSDYRYEFPREDPDFPEVYLYTDAMSYDPGDTVEFRGSTTARTNSAPTAQTLPSQPIALLVSPDPMTWLKLRTVQPTSSVPKTLTPLTGHPETRWITPRTNRKLRFCSYMAPLTRQSRSDSLSPLLPPLKTAGTPPL